MEDFCNPLRHQCRIGQARKFDAVNAVRILAVDLVGNAQGETRLAAASRACQRQKSGRGQQATDFGDVVLPSHKARKRDRDGGSESVWCCDVASNSSHNRSLHPVELKGNWGRNQWFQAYSWHSEAASVGHGPGWGASQSRTSSPRAVVVASIRLLN